MSNLQQQHRLEAIEAPKKPTVFLKATQSAWRTNLGNEVKLPPTWNKQTKRNTIQKFSEQGMTKAEIAKEINMSEKNVAANLCQMKPKSEKKQSKGEIAYNLKNFEFKSLEQIAEIMGLTKMQVSERICYYKKKMKL